MWVCRAFIFSLSIALLAVISSPARALEDSLPTLNHATYALADFPSDLENTDSTKVASCNTQLTQALPFDSFLQKHRSRKLSDNHSDNKKSEHALPIRTPTYQVGFNHNASFPPFERQATSAFGSLVQNEPIFVLAYEFLPEILGLKHFLTPLIVNSAVPWYLRPDAANSHSRLASWKDGNTLYTGTITYLS
ncbi:MAG: hypothetical protein ACI88A_002531 [Paraglaciecola sp.]|jgi:hypothetical protein